LVATVAGSLYLSLHPLDLESLFQSKIGRAVGLSISVAENPYNKLALELGQKEEQIALREQKLDQLQAEILANSRANRYIMITMTFFLLVLFFLIALNYYLDYQRRKSESRNDKQI
jgi:preprotein translocase subunit SecG